MTGWARRWGQSRRASARPGAGPPAVIVVCAYIVSYIALDWISFVQALPNIGFTLWDPAPAAGLALLVLKGLRFAPALFVAGVISDALIGGLPSSIGSTFAIEGITAVGYTGVAAALRRFTHAEQGFPRLVDVVW